MLGGGHVHCQSIGSLIEASPCVRIQKWKHSATQGIQIYKGEDLYDPSNKAWIVEKPPIASNSSSQFGGERMIKAQWGLLEWQSLEDSCLSADGDEMASACEFLFFDLFSPIVNTNCYLDCAMSVFTRPAPTTCSRSSTCTSSSSGNTSFSIWWIFKFWRLTIKYWFDFAFSNATHPMSTVARNRARARAGGTRHWQRYSKSHISHSSVYKTIKEEMLNASSPDKSLLSKKSSPTMCQPVFIVDSNTASVHSEPEKSTWDDKQGITTLRKY